MVNQAPNEIWFTGRDIKVNVSDYEPCPIEVSLNAVQCEIVKSFFRKLLWFREQSNVKVSQFMLAYRKERNGELFVKQQNVIKG